MCPDILIKGTTLGDVLEHHKRIVPAYSSCQGDVMRALKYIDQKKSEYGIEN